MNIEFQLAMADLALAYIFTTPDTRWCDHDINAVFDTFYGVCYAI